MSDYNGLNGTIMLNTPEHGIAVGTVPGGDYGYKANLPVTVRVRIERLERNETYHTIEHEQVTRPWGLSITTAVWNPRGDDTLAGGATAAPLREVAAHGRPREEWADGTLPYLASIHDRWHLNAMKAACAHQEVVYERGPAGRRPSLTETRPCPVTGYRYGSAWLVEPLPRLIVDDLLRMFTGPGVSGQVYVHPDLTA